jgi:hypothetical protein
MARVVYRAPGKWRQDEERCRVVAVMAFGLSKLRISFKAERKSYLAHWIRRWLFAGTVLQGEAVQ